jgi:hypothetical protein
MPIHGGGQPLLVRAHDAHAHLPPHTPQEDEQSRLVIPAAAAHAKTPAICPGEPALHPPPPSTAHAAHAAHHTSRPQ